MIKSYELTYLISPELSEEQVKDFQVKIISLIKEEEGILIEEKIPFKRKLAYDVKKHSQAFLASIFFKTLPEKLFILEKALKQEKEILRYLILIKKPVRRTKPARTFKGPKIEILKKEKKVDLEKIEKKLEEILK